jgi:uncharacterized membrane protein YqgA involved in biofilm formation
MIFRVGHDSQRETLRRATRERKLFFVSFAPSGRHNRRVIGPFLNALGILLGAFFGLVRREPLAARTQKSFQSALGAFTAFCGLHLLWLNTGTGATTVLKELLIAVLAVVFGNLLGKILGLQKISNHIGRHAANLLAAPQKNLPTKPADGFVAATILFCAAPLGLIGSVTDGLDNYFFPFVLKAVMDGLAMTSFVKMFRWPVALAAVPVFVFLNGLAIAVHKFVLPQLAATEMAHSIGAAAGLVVCATTLVILGIRRVELANYLPALALAPLLTHWLG